VETILAAGIIDVIVVVGPGGEDVAKAVGDFPVTVVENGNRESDMAGSVRKGLSALDENTESAFVCLCDHPFVSPRTLAAMSLCYEERPGTIVIPLYKGRKEHPALLPLLFLNEIGSVAAFRDVMNRHREEIFLMDTDDEGTVLDMDTWEDYQRILDRLHALRDGSLTG